MKEARSFRVEAVVLRHADWGEADRMLTLYTRERGKVRQLPRGHGGSARARPAISNRSRA